MQSRLGSGFTLIEIVCALALLAGALVTLAGLFVLAPRQIESGRGTTAALSAARRILEDLESVGFAGLPASLGADPAAVAHRVETGVDAAASRWASDLSTELGRARAVVDLRALGGASFGEARAVRVTVTVHWNESTRARRLRLVTVRT